MNVDTHTFNNLSVCAGVGSIDLGLKLAVPSTNTVCFVEWEAYACGVLATRMAEKCLDEAPIWTDIGSFDARPWRGVVDCITAGLPCQPFSIAGRQLGNNDERALAPHLARIVEECRPSVVFLENTPVWVSGGHFRGLGEELSRLGYTVEDPLFLAAEDLGIPHKRERVFILAHSNCHRWEGQQQIIREETNTDRSRDGCCPSWWASEPNVGRVADGVPARVDKFRAAGNGAVPLVVATAFDFLARHAGILGNTVRTPCQ